ncbi:hypothetical protein O6P43_004174 [Quillaja saponaria]|uniref:Uncharacterized protein n=1 Tax=Quillaja saponaria TaxID=32244 RepID=A0AAD7Q3H6_QUISA|nr:hypothetical protein O6P43_004174 [Quillaja saponaria]
MTSSAFPESSFIYLGIEVVAMFLQRAISISSYNTDLADVLRETDSIEVDDGFEKTEETPTSLQVTNQFIEKESNSIPWKGGGNEAEGKEKAKEGRVAHSPLQQEDEVLTGKIEGHKGAVEPCNIEILEEATYVSASHGNIHLMLIPHGFDHIHLGLDSLNKKEEASGIQTIAYVKKVIDDLQVGEDCRTPHVEVKMDEVSSQKRIGVCNRDIREINVSGVTMARLAVSDVPVNRNSHVSEVMDIAKGVEGHTHAEPKHHVVKVEELPRGNTSNHDPPMVHVFNKREVVMAEVNGKPTPSMGKVECFQIALQTCCRKFLISFEEVLTVCTQRMRATTMKQTEKETSNANRDGNSSFQQDNEATIGNREAAKL